MKKLEIRKNMSIPVSGTRGHKTEMAKQAIIRYIQEAKLRRGDKLPSQEELKSILGLSGTTVIRAIDELKSEGLVAARNKVGVFVQSDDLSGKVGRTVALLPFFDIDGISPFFTCLALRIQYKLRQVCSQTLIFPPRHLRRLEDFGVDDFPGLAESLESGKVHAIVDMVGLHGPSLDALAERQIPLTYVGAPYMVKNGVIVDLAEYCGSALELLRRHGCRRPAVVAPSGYIRNILLEVTARFFARHQLPFDPELSYLEVDAIEEGRHLGRRLLASPPERRPDGLVMADEFIGHDLLTGIALLEKNYPAYHPAVTIARNRQFRIAPPRDDVFFYDKDLDVIAELVVEHLLRQGNDHHGNPTMVYYQMRRGEDEAFFGAAPPARALEPDPEFSAVIGK